tara:strand:+ start:28111 stop:28917 length:807 start_codon:yes stop_codon:yes gene_type:complete
MTHAELLNSVKSISREAGNAILEVYNREGSIKYVYKDDHSPLTEADLAANKIITKALKELQADIPILSEESVDIDWDERRQWSKYWLVDPLDGTKEFIKGNGEFTVNIALIDNHVPVLGVVYVPVKNILYAGSSELGAFKETDGVSKAINVKHTSLEECAKIVASRSHRGTELDAWLDKVKSKFGEIELLSMGSSLKICLVAEGKADIYPRLALTSEWDTAAAQAILEAAGGTLTDAAFNLYRYNLKENILNPYFFAIGDKSFDWQGL